MEVALVVQSLPIIFILSKLNIADDIITKKVTMNGNNGIFLTKITVIYYAANYIFNY